MLSHRHTSTLASYPHTQKIQEDTRPYTEDTRRYKVRYTLQKQGSQSFLPAHGLTWPCCWRATHSALLHTHKYSLSFSYSEQSPHAGHFRGPHDRAKERPHVHSRESWWGVGGQKKSEQRGGAARRGRYGGGGRGAAGET